MAENDRTFAIVGAVAIVAFLGFLAFLIVQGRDRGGTLSVSPTPAGGFTIVEKVF